MERRIRSGRDGSNSSFGEEVDKEPQILLDLAKNNNLQIPLLNTNVDFCIGNRIGLFKKELLNAKAQADPAQVALRCAEDKQMGSRDRVRIQRI